MRFFVTQSRLFVPVAVWALMLSSCATKSPRTEATLESNDEAVLPAPTGYVTDFPKVLTADETAALERTLSSLDKTGRAQIIVYITGALGEHVLEDITLRSANAWGIGEHGKDNGLVIFLFMKEREMRIEVGLGLEKIISDEFAKRIIEENMVPAFRKSQFGEGLSSAADRIIKRLSEEL